MINSVTLVGRLTKSPEIRFTPNGKGVTTFTIACDRPFKNSQGEKETDFINIVVWGPAAESSANYLDKGKLAGIQGRLQIRNYDDQDGNKRWVTEVVASQVAFLSPKDSNNDGFIGGNVDFTDDDIPFNQ